MTSVEAWLYKAKNDLKSALKLLEGDDPIMDTAIYHTQQCAEKALKGYWYGSKYFGICRREDSVVG